MEAAFHDRKIYVFPRNIESIERMQFVVAHHEIRHRGSRSKFRGEDLGSMMLLDKNASVAAAAAADDKITVGLARKSPWDSHALIEWSEPALPGLYWLTLDFTGEEGSDHMSAPSESVMTVQEVADYLRVNQRTVYRLAMGRKLPSFKVGATWRFKRDDIDRWIAAQSSALDAGTEAANEGEDKNA